VILRRLLSDRVLIENRGSLEALYLFGRKNGGVTATPVDPPRPTRNAKNNRPLRDRLLQNPGSITDIVRISEARAGGQVIGYKVRPSKDAQTFARLGLEPDDLVKSVNGISLTEPSSALQVFQLLRTETDANFEIERAGQSLNVVVSLSDLEETDEEDDESHRPYDD
jgi:general secretion pathway protein C